MQNSIAKSTDLLLFILLQNKVPALEALASSSCELYRKRKQAKAFQEISPSVVGDIAEELILNV